MQIVLATDLSDYAADALRTATLVADAFGADLTAVLADSGRGAHARLQRWLDAHVPDRGVRGLVAPGPPVDALLTAADDVAADLIVLGAHPRHGIERLYLGHFAEAVLRESPRPVFTARRGMRAIHTIVCGVDCSDDARYALQSAVEWGDVFHAQVNAVNVIEPGTPGPHVVGELETWLPPELRARCQTRELVIRGGVSERLVAYAGALKADLIIVGTGAMESVVRRARCAVLAMLKAPVFAELAAV
ncbi:MAG TPA: universal stress protein [Thermoanaerobaculia bacterium]|nr:universal stress protein [Thermoanaerobaculia bacterium]